MPAPAFVRAENPTGCGGVRSRQKPAEVILDPFDSLGGQADLVMDITEHCNGLVLRHVRLNKKTHGFIELHDFCFLRARVPCRRPSSQVENDVVWNRSQVALLWPARIEAPCLAEFVGE